MPNLYGLGISTERRKRRLRRLSFLWLLAAIKNASPTRPKGGEAPTLQKINYGDISYHFAENGFMRYSKHIKIFDYIQKNIYCIVLNKRVSYYANL